MAELTEDQNAESIKDSKDELTEEQKDEAREMIASEIQEARKTVKTDDYAMSIGELINLYRDKELILDPEFQRLFRWKNEQKTKFIESILIGIPIPEIFVAQQSDGTWHVVDGVQRLSTIFQLLGELKDEDKLELTSCKYIPSLDEKKWEDLPLATQREFKRSKLRISIILTESSELAQYELFQRLNTGGTRLSEQEVRNCLILMLDSNFHQKLDELKEYPNFIKCLGLSESEVREEYHTELILRMYIGFAGVVDYGSYKSLRNTLMSEFIDRETIRLIEEHKIAEFEAVFKETYNLLVHIGKNSFRKYKQEKNDFDRQFNVSAFEMISTGVAFNVDALKGIPTSELREKIKNIYSEEKIATLLTRGQRVVPRFKGTTEFAKDYFGK